jgi:hypothetical protein
MAARIKESDVNEQLELMDLGDAIVETKQVSPDPPANLDWWFGLGSWPD